MIFKHTIQRYRAPAAMLLAFLFAPQQVVAEPTTAQTWGKQIYFEGTSPTGGEITAIVGTCLLYTSPSPRDS